MPSSFWKFLLLGLSLLPISPLLAERPLPREVEPRMSPPTRSSGYIFAGTVKSVVRVTPAGRSKIATIQITFHVDKAISGVRAGQTLVIHEWAGLWEFGERYRAGERVVLFLYPPSKLGLTSPVRGGLGRFRVSQDGQVAVRPGQIEGLGPSLRARFGARDRVGLDEFARELRRWRED